MRTLIIFLLLAICLIHSSQCVQVTDSGYSFSLKAVKTLKKLMKSDMSADLHQSYSKSSSLCVDPELPRELTAVCEKDDAATIFRNLVKIITHRLYGLFVMGQPSDILNRESLSSSCDQPLFKPV